MAPVLYLVTSYRSPDQLLRLVGTLRRESPSAEILVHHDQFRTKLDPLTVAEAAPGARVLTSPSPLFWGDFSVVDMHWRCFDWALHHVDFDWLVLLSEQDYPVRSLPETEALLCKSDADVFMDAYTVDATATWPRALGYYRYFYAYSALPGAAGLHRLPVPWAPAYRQFRQLMVNRINGRPRRLIRAETYPDGMPTRFGIRRRSTPFAGSFACWVAKAWFALSRDAVTRVVSFTRTHPDYGRYYRRTIVPEESATASIMMNLPALRVVAKDLHFERWSNPYSGHPDVLCRDDVEEIISSGAAFARKFDLQVDSEVLDVLDNVRRRPSRKTEDEIGGSSPNEGSGRPSKSPPAR